MLESTVPASTGQSRILWKLEPWLASHGKTRNQLAEEMDGEVTSNRVTIYRLEGQKRLDFVTLTKIIEACGRLTGKEPTVCDLLEFK